MHGKDAVQGDALTMMMVLLIIARVLILTGVICSKMRTSDSSMNQVLLHL